MIKKKRDGSGLSGRCFKCRSMAYVKDAKGRWECAECWLQRHRFPRKRKGV